MYQPFQPPPQQSCLFRPSSNPCPRSYQSSSSLPTSPKCYTPSSLPFRAHPLYATHIISSSKLVYLSASTACLFLHRRCLYSLFFSRPLKPIPKAICRRSYFLYFSPPMSDLDHSSDYVSDDSRGTIQDSKLEFTEDEETLIARMFNLLGERWSLIAGRIPGRTAEEIEKYWTSRYSSSE